MAHPSALPAALRTAAARVACVADARTEDGYGALLRGAGCETIAVERRDAELLAMIDRVEARLRVARMLAPPGEQHDRAELAHPPRERQRRPGDDRLTYRGKYDPSEGCPVGSTQ